MLLFRVIRDSLNKNKFGFKLRWISSLITRSAVGCKLCWITFAVLLSMLECTPDDFMATMPLRYGVQLRDQHCTSVVQSVPRYSRTFLYGFRSAAGRPSPDSLDNLARLGVLRYRGTRAGRHVHMRRVRLAERERFYDKLRQRADDLEAEMPIIQIKSTFRILRPVRQNTRVLIDLYCIY